MNAHHTRRGLIVRLALRGRLPWPVALRLLKRVGGLAMRRLDARRHRFRTAIH